MCCSAQAAASPWNVDSVTLRDDGGSVTVDGKPLVFFHFHRVRVRATRIRLACRATSASPEPFQVHLSPLPGRFGRGPGPRLGRRPILQWRPRAGSRRSAAVRRGARGCRCARRRQRRGLPGSATAGRFAPNNVSTRRPRASTAAGAAEVRFQPAQSATLDLFEGPPKRLRPPGRQPPTANELSLARARTRSRAAAPLAEPALVPKSLKYSTSTRRGRPVADVEDRCLRARRGSGDQPLDPWSTAPGGVGHPEAAAPRESVGTSANLSSPFVGVDDPRLELGHQHRVC